MTWDPTQYLAFADHRLRPALDLLSRIRIERAPHVVDLGCGPGNVTKLLRERWPAAAVIGVDSSPAMLERARLADPAVDWRLADLRDWRPPHPVDVLYSNAALHWVDDHATLFPELAALVAPGGVLAVQMPNNFAAPSHTAIAATVREGPWRARLEPLLRPAPVETPAYYHRILRPHMAEIDVWETTYLQVLAGDDPVAEFVKGSALAPFLDALAGDERAAFERSYREKTRAAYPRDTDGTTLFPFRRLFIVARRLRA